MFIQVMQGKSSKRAEVRELGSRWQDEVGAGPGFLGATFGFTDDDDWFGVVRFESREAAMSNSERPETGEFSAKMGELMDGPVEFHDSDDVIEFLDGGSDDAKFVQIIRGRSDDRGAWKTLLDDSDGLRQMRPDIIGGTVAIEPDGSFTETIAFTDEASAREGEKNSGEIPPEVGEALQSLTEGAKFYDLREVWFESP